MSEDKKDKESNQDKINALKAELEELKAKEELKNLNAEIDSLKKNTSTKKKDERKFYQKKRIIIPVVFVFLSAIGSIFVQKDIQQLVEKCSNGSSEACERLESEYEYRVVNGKKVEIQKEESPQSKRVGQITRCKTLLKQSLKDPRSFKELNGIMDQYQTGIIRYSATNSFGGRIQSTFDCFN